MSAEWVGIIIAVIGLFLNFVAMLCGAVWFMAEIRTTARVTETNLANLAQKFQTGSAQLSGSIDNLASVVKSLDDRQRANESAIAVLQARSESQ